MIALRACYHHGHGETADEDDRSVVGDHESIPPLVLVSSCSAEVNHGVLRGLCGLDTFSVQHHALLGIHRSVFPGDFGGYGVPSTLFQGAGLVIFAKKTEKAGSAQETEKETKESAVETDTKKEESETEAGTETKAEESKAEATTKAAAKTAAI